MMMTADENTSDRCDWHIILSRQYVNTGLDDAPSSVRERAVTIRDTLYSCGWNISVYRLEAGIFGDACDDVSEENKRKKQRTAIAMEGATAADAAPFLPVEVAERLHSEMKKRGVLDGTDLFDFDNPNYLDSFEDIVLAPYGCYRTMVLSKRQLINYAECVNMEGMPLMLIKKTMEVLSNHKFRGVKPICNGDADSRPNGDFNEFSHEIFSDEADWIAAAQPPRSITLHIALDEEILPGKDGLSLEKKISASFPDAQVNVNRELTDDVNAAPEKRLMWALEFASQMRRRFLARGNNGTLQGERSSGVAGIFNFGTYQYNLRGTTLDNVPDESKLDVYRAVYKAANRLLSQQPWTVFAPFEILQVVILEGEKETNRWALFHSEDASGFGGFKSEPTPFGSLQIQERFDDFEYMFGRQQMMLRSGFGSYYDYPDRLYVSTNAIFSVHYDTLYFLTKLFGNLPGTGPGLDFGVVPNLDVEIGPPNRSDWLLAGDVQRRPSGGRPPTEREFVIAGKVYSALAHFVEEKKKLKFRPSGGKVERTYRTDFDNGRTDSVKVIYNMDRENGGIWDAHVKWMWFD